MRSVWKRTYCASPDNAHPSQWICLPFSSTTFALSTNTLGSVVFCTVLSKMLWSPSTTEYVPSGAARQRVESRPERQLRTFFDPIYRYCIRIESSVENVVHRDMLIPPANEVRRRGVSPSSQDANNPSKSNDPNQHSEDPLRLSPRS